MKIFHTYENCPREFKRAAVALGNFDGVHLGHQAVVARAKEIAANLGVPSAVLTFAPHPRRFFRPDDNFFELTPGIRKERPISELGVDALFFIEFDKNLASMAAKTFVNDVLVDGLGISHVISGYDFVFGNGRQGNLALLESLGTQNSFGASVVEAVSPHTGSKSPISSTAIRNHIRAGRVGQAANLLGRPWEIEGIVVTGDQRGREIGFPTANIDPGDYLRPALGVYACWVSDASDQNPDWCQGVVNIGKRPTFAGEDVTIEAHLFDVDRDLYGKNMRLVLAHYIRPEIKFESMDAIRSQIQKDSRGARAILQGKAPGNISSIGDDL
ncbi:MAG: bifunctional riboflavin kinase/FAD synthetase [Rhodospirillaceae bacterium]